MVHGKRVELRIESVLADRAKRTALQRGVSLSEFVRDAVRRSMEVRA